MLDTAAPRSATPETVPAKRPKPPRKRLTRAERRAARRQRKLAETHRSYEACNELAGPLTTPGAPHQPVVFRHTARPWQRVMLTLLIAANLLTGLVFLGWLVLPQHIPGPRLLHVGAGDWHVIVARVAFCFVVLVEAVRLLQNIAVWVFAWKARDPVPMVPERGLRIAMLTTIVPSKEPIDVVERSLMAMQKVRYPGQVDIWILDEGDDPRVKAMAKRLGVHHFSRKGRPEFNQEHGAFRAKTKSGNHNAWRATHEHVYDVVAQMDPDHVPLPSFLERTVGYFRDPDVAFVVAPQVYGNMYNGWVVHGASVQQYLFSGLIERGGNGLDAPLLIGTNHLYRPLAWALIDGYQDSIIEDHLTSMVVMGAKNPLTDRRWKGVYTPDVLAIGEGPTSWTDYFNQQKRWAYGVWEILLRRSRPHLRRLSAAQRICYGLVQSYYPSVALSAVSGVAATAAYLGLGVNAAQIEWKLWLGLWGASMGTWAVLWLWLRRFNLARHERKEIGVHGMFLALFAVPVYVAAGTAALLRRPLAYAVTAKGRLRSVDGPRTFRTHFVWAFVGAALIGSSFYFGYDSIALRFWAGLSVGVGLFPPLIAFCTWLRDRRLEEPEEEELPPTLIMTIKATASAHASLDVSDLPTVAGIPAVPHAGVPAPRVPLGDSA
ncbi:glycosyl transferase [Dactylosporangium sucinum]|uniref:Glycosyl transferase n=2 Tax=Dactylosporangium sucinum TaxID=1424081 RepID=A0A917TGN5_9ACTN|nr:glycosyl transferase [Dactylosporangium sucinum]